MGDEFIRIGGRTTHKDLYDADLHDATIQWLAAQFDANGSSFRFPPGTRTSGGVATRPLECDNIDDSTCADALMRIVCECDRVLRFDKLAGEWVFVLDKASATTAVSTPPDSEQTTRALELEERSSVRLPRDICPEPLRKCTSFRNPIGCVENGLDPSDPPYRGHCALSECADDPCGGDCGGEPRAEDCGGETPAVGLCMGRDEPPDAGQEVCRCQQVDMPVGGSTVYFKTPGLRFPLTARSAFCGSEYIGGEIAGWLAELDELYELIRAGWQIPAVYGCEPPISGAGAAARVDVLRRAIRELLSEGETALRLSRLPESVRTL